MDKGKGKGGLDWLSQGGWVKTWNDPQGFGFVCLEAGGDVYVHRSVLADGQMLVKDSQVWVEASWNYDKGSWQASSCSGAISPIIG